MRTTLVIPKVMLAVAVLGVLILWGCSSAQPGSGVAGYQGPTFPGGERTTDVTVSVSKPSNNTNFQAKDKPVVTVTLKDASGNALKREDFATLNLYLYGPQDPAKTVTAVKMLNASTDRSQTPHHYIDLIKNPDVKVKGNVLTYELKPVSDEEPGTYTASVYAVQKDNGIQQTMVLADLQIKTATAEKQLVEKDKCATCHLGASSGKMYFAHVDVGRSPTGNWSLDFEPVRTCKSCHNNDGYSAYAGNIEDPTGPNTVRTPDPIVRRVHGVHMGEELANTFNTDPKTGNFKNYLGVVFPADVKNCTACHVDDRWKTEPSRQACGACHDKIWFDDTASMPKTFTAHPGGPRVTDNACGRCHTPDGTEKTAIPVAHDPKVNLEYDEAVVSLSPPKNGKFFVAGEKPVVTIVYKDEKGNPRDHTKVDTATYAAANLYVYGPREGSKPVLTRAARIGISLSKASATNTILAAGTPKGWTFAAGDTLRIAVKPGGVQELAAPAGLQTPTQVAAWLSASLPGATITANETAGTVNILSNVAGDDSRIEIYNSSVSTKMGWKPVPLNITENGKVVGQTVGTTMEPFIAIGTLSTVANDLRATVDTAIKRTAGNVTYELDDVKGLAPGTYMVNTYANLATGKTKNGWAKSAFGFTTFQVGIEKEELKVAGNCAQCHGNTVMHLNEANVHPVAFVNAPDGCKACHDYDRPGTGEGYSRTGGTSTNGWAGYGAKPIAARAHGVHRGAYLSHKEDVYAGNPNMASEIIFPQDIRNCTKCHDPAGSPAWKEEPSRLACLACHDSDSAQAHAKLMTKPSASVEDPWGSGATETCKICHGAGRDFSPDKVHSLTPYKPPYPREE